MPLSVGEGPNSMKRSKEYGALKKTSCVSILRSV
jgi:hypothetical protein